MFWSGHPEQQRSNKGTTKNTDYTKFQGKDVTQSLYMLFTKVRKKSGLGMRLEACFPSVLSVLSVVAIALLRLT